MIHANIRDQKKKWGKGKGKRKTEGRKWVGGMLQIA